MSNNLGKVARGGVVFGVGAVFANIAQFLFGIMIIRVMPAEDFGVVSIAMTLVTIFVTLSVLGFQNGLPRFVSLNKASNDKYVISQLMGGSLLFVFLLSTFFSILLYLCRLYISDIFNMPLLSDAITYFLFIVPPMSLMLVFNSLFRGVGNSKAKVLYQDISLNFTKLALLIIVSGYFVYKSEVIFWIYIISAYMTFIMYLFYLYRKMLTKYPPRMNYEIIKQLIIFSFPLLGVALSTNIINWAGVLSLGYFDNAQSVAFFSAGLRAAQILTIPLLAMGFLFLPVATNLIAKQKDLDVNNLYIGVTKWISLLVVAPMIYLIVDSDYFLTNVFGEEYMAVGSAMTLLVIASFIHVLMGPNSMTVVAHGDSKTVFVAAVIASIISVALSLFLVPIYGVTGAAVAISSAQVISNSYISWKLYVKYNVHIFNRVLLLPLAFSLVVNIMVVQLIGLFMPFGDSTYALCFPLMVIISLISPYLCRCVTEDDLNIVRAFKKKLA